MNALGIPTKLYCRELRFQMRYRLAGKEWTTVDVDVPRFTLKGLYLNKKYEVSFPKHTTCTHT